MIWIATCDVTCDNLSVVLNYLKSWIYRLWPKMSKQAAAAALRSGCACLVLFCWFSFLGWLNINSIKSTGGKSQRREEKKKQDQRRERVRRKKMQVREKVEKS